MVPLDGNLSMGKDSKIEISGDGVLVVTGNFSSDNKSDINNNGIIAIKGDMAFHSSPHDDYDGSGDLYVDGDIANNGDAEAIEKKLSELKPAHTDIYDMVTGGISTLPITLVYFKATAQDDKVVLKWEMTEEVNTAFFTVERSTDGRTFTNIGTVKGAGNSHEIRTYSYSDPYPANGLSYYRLKQTDFDGKFERFKVVAVSREAITTDPNSVIKLVTPNPCSASFHMDYEVPTSGTVHL
uniref:Uncharacterized protein n=1 Tax=Roseihalotalea indica TaxID=2867963 RepID=A0AA49JID2_9BACT|nr:hypothetical protein K4G66_18915 [Tunicatimonas sp. TK19036]